MTSARPTSTISSDGNLYDMPDDLTRGTYYSEIPLDPVTSAWIPSMVTSRMREGGTREIAPEPPPRPERAADGYEDMAETDSNRGKYCSANEV